MEFLSDLNVKRNAADGRSDWNTELRNASDPRCDEVYRRFIGRPKVNLYGLETTTAIGDGNVDAVRCQQVEIMRNFMRNVNSSKPSARARSSAKNRSRRLPGRPMSISLVVRARLQSAAQVPRRLRW